MITAVIVIVTIIAIGLFSTILYFLFNKELIANDSGKVMFEIDYKKRKIRNINHPSLSGTKIPNSQKISAFYNGKWMDLDKFMTFFDKATNKKYRNAMHDIENEKDVKVSFEINALKNHQPKKTTRKGKIAKMFEWKGKKNFTMTTTMFKCDNSFIGGEIKFFLPNPEFKTTFTERIESSSLGTFDSKFIGFWVFNMRETTLETKNIFFQQMKKAIGLSDMKYFLYENKLVLVMPTTSLIFIKKKIAKRKQNIQKVLNKKGAKKYFDQSGTLFTKRIDSPKKNSELLIKLDYVIWKSLKLNTESTYAADDIQVFQKYKHAYITIEQTIKAKSMQTIETRVKKFGGKRAIIKYIFPDIKDTPSRFIAMVLTNDIMRVKMMNAHAEKITSEVASSPGIMDVDALWLIDNARKIVNNKIIYMVEYDDKTPQKLLFAIIMQLQERGILCGIRIRKADVKDMTALTRVAPKFIVIDRELSKIAHSSETYVKLSTIREVAAKKGTKMIYELPSLKLDAKQRKVIGLEFYYDYK
ncbi:MHO_4530 family protein [Mycoplasma todarodis]|uniref:MHO_4530 family protein n=1 Tax=Mycoplasma todarodis TaxID=1937191 RepID=UPI003B32BABA